MLPLKNHIGFTQGILLGLILLIHSVSALAFEKLLPGNKIPPLKLYTLQQTTLAMSEVNRPITLVFIDSLCPMPQLPECEIKLATIAQLSQADTGRLWVGIINSYYVTEASAQAFAERFLLKFPLVFDQGNAIFKQFGVFATPYQIDIDAAGVVNYRGDQLH